MATVFHSSNKWLDDISSGGTLDQRFVDTAYVVEATDEESFSAWWKWSEHYHVPWQQESLGIGLTIALLDHRPIVAQTHWNIIGPARVAFVDMSSEVTDWSVFKKWQEVVFANARRHSDASNFGDIINAIEENNSIKLFDRKRIDYIERVMELCWSGASEPLVSARR
jgi:hypothetical protein